MRKMDGEERAIMEYVVLNPDLWIETCLKNHGEENTTLFLKIKIDRWRSKFEAAALEEAGNYRNRTARDAGENLLSAASAATAAKKAQQQRMRNRIANERDSRN